LYKKIINFLKKKFPLELSIYYKFRFVFRAIKVNLSNPIYKDKINNTHFSRIYHFHIRKCGGSSLNVAFSKFPNGNSKNYQIVASQHENKAIFNNVPIVGWNLKQLKRGDFWYGFSHIEFERIFPLKKNTFTFTFLRDPIERLLSHYNMIKDWENNENPHPAFEIEGRWLGNSFSEFLDKIPKQHLQNQLFMFSTSFDIDTALKNLKKIDFVGVVGRDEEKLLNYFREYFDINLDYFHTRKSAYSYILDEREMKLLKNKLEDEILFFEKAKLQIVENLKNFKIKN
jgi:hypothetical protein